MLPNKRILIWDTETYGMRLAGDSARIIVLAWKWLGEKPLGSVRIDDFREYKKDPTNDLWLLKTFETVYNQADMTVAHYGSGFDLPEMNTRRAIHGLKPLPPVKMYDTWYVLKKTFNLKSNSLKNASNVFGLTTKKMEVPWTVWDKAAAGHKPSLDVIEQRCKSDVVELEELYLKISPFMPQYTVNVHNATKDNGVCRVCGKKHLTKQGYQVKQTKKFHQYQCQDCGAWQTGAEVK